jgi:hypothetical protein
MPRPQSEVHRSQERLSSQSSFSQQSSSSWSRPNRELLSPAPDTQEVRDSFDALFNERARYACRRGGRDPGGARGDGHSRELNNPDGTGAERPSRHEGRDPGPGGARGDGHSREPDVHNPDGTGAERPSKRR